VHGAGGIGPRANRQGEESSVDINIGISEADRKAIADGLSHVMADTYSLYLKTHNYHWNVTGPMFRTLHLMFEEQYNELWTAVDLIAERIRALGYFAPGTLHRARGPDQYQGGRGHSAGKGDDPKSGQGSRAGGDDGAQVIPDRGEGE
jgi:starvation-inducible DNA-binding protein